MQKQRHRSVGSQSLGGASDPETAAGGRRPSAGPDDLLPDDLLPDDLLDVLGDEYTRLALSAIRDGPMSGAEVAEATSMSKPTAFRRLNELVEIGFASTRHRIDPDAGHHHKEYCLVVDSISVSFGEEDLDVTVRPEDAERERVACVAPLDD
ncbi:hypothetical protein GCM10028857_20170 [Salinarchaeum chitinilyticum]